MGGDVKIPINRRRLLQGVSTLALMEGSGLMRDAAAAEEPFEFSAGTAQAKVKAPLNACDCHFHIYDGRFRAAANASLKPPDALVSNYLKVQQRLGASRGVIVTPSTYGTDNSCTLDALSKLGSSFRAVAVVDTSVTDEELKRLNGLGVRGIRFNIARAGATTVEMIEPLSKRIAEFGWHVQIHMSAADIAESAGILLRLPVPIVFDHLGRIPTEDGLKHSTFLLIRELMAKRRAFVKVSSPYQETKVGPPSYSDVAEIAKAYIAAAPDQVLWGSDWPHPSKGAYGMPDDALLFDLVADWAGAANWQRILVDNPERLYGFPTSS